MPWSIVGTKIVEDEQGVYPSYAKAVKELRVLRMADVDLSSISRFDEPIIETTDEPNTFWVQSFKLGKWDHPVYGEVVIDSRVADQFIDNFKSNVYGQDLPYLYEHGLDRSKGMKAAGWIRDMEIRDGAIFDKVEFTDVALDEIKSGEWKYISPEYKEIYTNAETGDEHINVRVAGSVTNTPFFKGMAPLNFSDVTYDDPLDLNSVTWSFAVWSAAYVNNLPDSSFLYIEAGGKKDSEGKTVPRSLRHLPVKDADGNVDEAHVRNAIARAPQIKGISSAKASSLQDAARRLLSGTKKGSEVVNELVKKFAAVFGVELTDEMDEEAILAEAKKLNEVIEPLRKSKEDGEKIQSFREMFPEEYAEHIKLKEDKVERDALAFSENYSRFTVKDGDDEKKSPYGFSQKVKDKIAETHKKFSNREVTKEDLKELLDLIGDNGIVDYSERGSSRFDDSGDYKPTNSDPAMAFNEKIVELMESDELTYEKAMELARKKFPEVYESYKKNVPVIAS